MRTDLSRTQADARNTAAMTPGWHIHHATRQPTIDALVLKGLAEPCTCPCRGYRLSTDGYVSAPVQFRTQPAARVKAGIL